MIGNIAVGLIAISLITEIIAIVTAINARRENSKAIFESSRRAALCSFPLLTIALGLLLCLLLSNQFEYVYVYQTVDTTLPAYLKIAALWGGQEGSLLFWCWLLSAFIFAALIKKNDLDHTLTPWVIIVSSFTLGFFLLLVIFIENPFLHFYINMNGDLIKAIIQPPYTLQANPDHGTGMNPLLYHIGMVLHPPALYLGFVGFIIPFSYAIAALITKQKDDLWIRKSQKWSLLAWLFLSIGLVLGSRWAYDVLGWGGYWNWDPVEVAALLPWLTSTAYLHSSLVQEKRGFFKHWSASLIILTFCSVILGTFLTRSGLLSSVHAFNQSAIGIYFFIFTAVMLLGSVILLGVRWSSMKTPFELKSYFSRETIFIFNNLLFITIFLICLLGIFFPILSELFTGQQINVGPQYYKNATGPLFAVLVVIMGVVPLTAWSATSGRNLGKTIWRPLVISLVFPILALLFKINELGAVIAFWIIGASILLTIFDYFRSVSIHSKANQYSVAKSAWRLIHHNRRKYGAYLIHIGVAIMGLGIVGIEFLQSQTQVTLKQNDTAQFAGYSITYQDLVIDNSLPDREIARSIVKVTSPNGVQFFLYPDRNFYYTSGQSVTNPGLRSTPVDDLYVILVDWLPVTSEGATFKIYRNPLVFWLWAGTFVLVFGTMMALWPRKSLRKTGRSGI